MPAHFAFSQANQPPDIQAQIDQFKTEVASLLQVSLSSHLRDLLHQVTASDQISEKMKTEYRATLQDLIHTVQNGKPIFGSSDKIGQIIHAINAANAAAAVSKGAKPEDLKSCLKECDDAYDSAVQNCNQMPPGASREYCLNQAIEASSACQDSCSANNPK
jgi:hypothetical protein